MNKNRNIARTGSGNQHSKNGKPITKKLDRRNSSKSSRREAEAIDSELADYRSKSNPYTWYANFPNYAKDVATLAFGVPVGAPVYLGPGTDYVANAGIMTLSFTPTPSISTSPSSPLNRQAVRIMSYLRSIQRTSSDYDAADLMIYLLAIDSLYTYWAFLRRVYGVAQLFTPTNVYYPRRLLQAMGIDPDIVSNLANLRAYVNRFALNIGRYTVPKDFDLIQRHMWMASGLYVDSTSTRAQTYMFMPALLWQYDNTVTTGSQLVGVKLDTFTAATNSMKLQDLVDYGESLIAALNNDDDAFMISGDLFRAYGNNVFSVEETPDNYAVKPVYDETVLSQIENATIVGIFCSSTSLDYAAPVITQNPTINNGAIIFNPYVSGGARQTHTGTFVHTYPLIIGNTPLNYHGDSPTPEAVMEMTRLTAQSSTDQIFTPSGQGIQLRSSAADMINYVRITTTSPTNPAAIRNLYIASQSIYTDEEGTVISSFTPSELAILMQFDWCPMFYVCTVNAALQTLDLQWVAADIDNFTVASAEQMYNIQEAAALSLLDSPTPIAK